MPSTLTFTPVGQSAGVYAAEPNRICRLVEQCSFILLGALLVFGPLAFGAVQAWSASVLHIGATVLILLWAARQVLAGSILITRHPLMLPSALFGFLICVQFAARIPVYLYDAQEGALNLAAFGMVMFAASQLLREDHYLRRLMWMLMIFGFAVAVFAAAQNFSAPGKLYWTIVPRQGGWVFGPYVNHNHYAGLMELLIPIPLALSLRSRDWSRRTLFGFIAAMMIGSVALSQSRGGMVAVACEILFVVAAVLFKNNQRRPTGTLLVLAIATIAILTWMAGTSVRDRFENTKEELQVSGDSGFVRVMIVKDSVGLIKERPLLGWGLRMFPVVFPKYRTFYTNQFINEAHNDYLQYLVETGIVGFSIILYFLTRLVRVAAGNISCWRASENSALRFAALTACLGILVHSFTDFNLQIPANALLFFVMCVIAAGVTTPEPINAYYPIKAPQRLPHRSI